VLKAPLFYVLLAVGTLGGTALTVTSINPISLLVLVAIVNGIAAAPFLIVVMIISRNRVLMGASRNRRLAATLGWGTVAPMTAAAIAMLALLIGQ
jgi:Mn2+/Fe2+ NRAMP family transporter